MRALLIIALAAAGCASQGSDRPGTEFRGIYVSGFEVLSFQPCGSLERWWVPQSGPLGQQYRDLVAEAYEPVFAVVRGETSRLGKYGHMSSYDRELRISDVVSVSVLEPGDRDGALACR
jgi:hypothetical protein